MTRTEKMQAIEQLKESFEKHQFFYLTDSSAMSVAQINDLRRLCFEKGVTMQVVKNTLAIKALEQLPEEGGYKGLFESLKGPTTIMFAENASIPAKVIKEFRGEKKERPVLKAAFIDTDIFVGDDQLNALNALKSKEDLVGEVLILLQSPIKNVLGSLNSGAHTLSGLLKALEDRAEG